MPGCVPALCISPRTEIGHNRPKKKTTRGTKTQQLPVLLLQGSTIIMTDWEEFIGHSFRQSIQFIEETPPHLPPRGTTVWRRWIGVSELWLSAVKGFWHKTSSRGPAPPPPAFLSHSLHRRLSLFIHHVVRFLPFVFVLPSHPSVSPDIIWNE